MNSGNKIIEVLALIFGIISIPMACGYAIIGLLIGIIGMIMAYRQYKISRSPIAMAAMVCSVIGILVGAFSMLFMIVFYIMAVR